MGRISAAFTLPHPPILIPAIGKGQEKKAIKTLEGIEVVVGKAASIKPENIIFITPHGPVFSDFIYISNKPVLWGDLSRFGSPEVKLTVDNNLELAERIINKAAMKGIFSGGLKESLMKKHKISGELDHGTLVPLYFLFLPNYNMKDRPPTPMDTLQRAKSIAQEYLKHVSLGNV